MASSDREKAQPALETSFGERFVLRDTAADTDGELLRIDASLDPGVRRPLHTHPKQDERFVVREGTLGVALEDTKFSLEPGDEISVPAGTPHTFWNVGGDRVRMTTEHRPALRFEEFLRAMVELDRRNGLDSAGMPANPLVGAALLDEFDEEMRPADIPAPVQRIVFPALATVGRRLGYGAPDYSTTAEEQERT